MRKRQLKPGKTHCHPCGNCPKIRRSFHSPIAGPGLPAITKSSSKKISAVTSKRTAWPQEIPKWRRSALPWTLDDLLKMGKARLLDDLLKMGKARLLDDPESALKITAADRRRPMSRIGAEDHRRRPPPTDVPNRR